MSEYLFALYIPYFLYLSLMYLVIVMISAYDSAVVVLGFVLQFKCANRTEIFAKQWHIGVFHFIKQWSL